jgi:hypothetical protein
MPKGCFVQPFVKLGVRKPELGEVFGLPKTIDSFNIITFARPKCKSMQTFGAFILASSTSSSYHIEHVSPSRNLHIEKDHKLVSASKRPNNDPSSPTP